MECCCPELFLMALTKQDLGCCCGGQPCQACGGVNLASGSVTDSLGTTEFTYSTPHTQWEALPSSTFSVSRTTGCTGAGVGVCGTLDQNYGYAFTCNPNGTVRATMYSWGGSLAGTPCATLYENFPPTSMASSQARARQRDRISAWFPAVAC